MSSTKITDCVPELQKAWPRIKLAFEDEYGMRYTLKLTCTHRPPEEQFVLFQKGRKFDINGNIIKIDRKKIVTNVDGTKIIGAHNYYPARAFDMGVIDDRTKKITWKKEPYYPLFDLCKLQGLENGGRWKGLEDWPHCQIRDYQNYGRKIRLKEKGIFALFLAFFLR